MVFVNTFFGKSFPFLSLLFFSLLGRGRKKARKGEMIMLMRSVSRMVVPLAAWRKRLTFDNIVRRI
jgi:hypothetical protein